MSDASQGRTASWWPWIAVIVGLVALNTFLLGTQTGVCTDYTAEGLEGTCTIGPAIGVPAMWIVGVMSILAVAYCIRRIVRIRRLSRT
jgi:hypothetical protein